MSASYRAVNWNRQKLIYDGLLAAGVAVYLLLFAGITLLRDGNATLETALIRGLGTGALLLLTSSWPSARWPGSTPASCRCSTTAATSASPCACWRWRMAASRWSSSTPWATCNPLVSLLTAAADSARSGAFPSSCWAWPRC